MDNRSITVCGLDGEYGRGEHMWCGVERTGCVSRVISRER